MKDKIIDSIGKIDDDMIESVDALRRKKRTRQMRLKFGAAAACLCLIIVSAAAILNSISGISADSLVGKLSEMGINAEEISDPLFVSDREMPVISEKDIIQSVRSNLTVQGTVTAIESVRIKDADVVWYITTADIAVEEVLNGTAPSDELHIVGAAVYSGVPDEQTTPVYGLTGKGSSGVFVLHEHDDDGVWTVFDKQIPVKSLGDYYICYNLDRSGDNLTFREQNVTVSLTDIA